MIRLAIFASGHGSNAQAIMKYFANHNKILISGVFTNNPKAGVIARCKSENIECVVFDNGDLVNGKLCEKLLSKGINGIVLAGFLRKIPYHMLQNFPNKILNIHPSLLPKYGGKGMYGDFVHRAVLENKEKKTGITIHLVNENYDEGKFLHQSEVNLESHDTIESVRKKVATLELADYSKVVEAYFLSQNIWPE
ncbi:MAG: phosphoribosylglycinamide formyltransferase [Bacteroidota bacterium]|nr:phosphoribosylglycinamide formyltransferase [Bacteroidota bacterium]